MSASNLMQIQSPMKYVIISGGVVSGLGKGITASSIGLLLKQSGLRVTAIKIDPYLNIDAGTMSPYEHGEVYVLDDGGEVDLDLGNYERFLDITLTSSHNITTGKIYNKVLTTERRGDYLGKTVQMVPHVTNCIQDWIESVAIKPVDSTGLTPEICIIELGGTVGDIESVIFLEAIRQFKFRLADNNLFHCHVSLIPSLGNVGELKSKPTQHSMVTLRSTGLIPDCVVLRCTKIVPLNIRNKVSINSMVPIKNIIGVHDVNNIYQVPNLLLKQGVLNNIFNKLNINRNKYNPLIDLSLWNKIANQLTDNEADKQQIVTIGIVGKYTGLSDSYLSVTKALISASLKNNLQLKIVWIESSNLEKKTNNNNNSDDNISDNSSSPEKSPSIGDMKDLIHNISVIADNDVNNDINNDTVYLNAWKKLKSVDGILIPGGFGDRGIEGKILAVNYARINKKPFLGICLGLQMAVIEYCRNVLSLNNANSDEFDKNTLYPVIKFMPEVNKLNMGGTMRLGKRLCNLRNNSLALYLYNNNKIIYERHRHRYEVNPSYINNIELNGLLFTGKDLKNERMEIIELPLGKHPFFFGCQFHPEFKSGPLRPSPPFEGLIKASSGKLYKEKKFIKLFGNIKIPLTKHRIHIRSPKKTTNIKVKPNRVFFNKTNNNNTLSVITDLLNKLDNGNKGNK